MTKYYVARDINNYPVWSVPFPPDDGNVQGKEVLLTLAGGEQTFVVPVGIKRIWINYNAGATVYVKNSTAPVVIPSSSTFVDSITVINPSVREVNEGDTIRFISEDDAIVTVQFDEVL